MPSLGEILRELTTPEGPQSAVYGRNGFTRLCNPDSHATGIPSTSCLILPRLQGRRSRPLVDLRDSWSPRTESLGRIIREQAIKKNGG
jgi:hypothetical protein